MARSLHNRRQIVLSASAFLAAPCLVRPAGAQTRARLNEVISLPGDITSGEQATVTRVRTDRPLVAMTFDDGPHASLTPQLLDILGARSIRATFYVIGNRVARHPQLMQRMVAAGHEVGNHTWSHPSMYGLSDAAVLSEIDRTSQAIYDTVGRPPVTMRPPYGNAYTRQRLMIHQARNLPTVLWSVDPEDWCRPGSSVVAHRIISASHPGAIVLAHDIHAPTVRAMPAALDGLLARGFQFVTMSELLGWPRWDSRRIRLVAAS